MLLKEQIMLTTLNLFAEHGIKNVSMDQIAQNIGISKRTLYELFADKETLLTQCIHQNHIHIKTAFKQLESEPITALDVILLFYQELMKRPRWFSQKFYDDLKRYPKARQKTEKGNIYFMRKCANLLERGVKENIFEPNINIKVITLLAKELVKMIRPTQAFSNYSASEISGTLIYTFLRGMATEKGLNILDRYLLKYTQVKFKQSV